MWTEVSSSAITQSPWWTSPPPGSPKGPLWKDTVYRAFSTYPSGSQAREPSLQVSFTELPQRETLHLQSPFQPYLKVPGRWAHSRLLNWAPVKRDAHPQSLPFITFRSPSKDALSPGSPNRVPIERGAPFPEPPYNYQSSGWTDPPGVMSVPRSLIPYPYGSAVRSRPNRAPAKRNARFLKPSNYFLKFPVSGLPSFPKVSLWRQAPISRIFFYPFPS